MRAWIFFGLASMPLWLTMKPNNLPKPTPNAHLARFNFILYSLRMKKVFGKICDILVSAYTFYQHVVDIYLHAADDLPSKHLVDQSLVSSPKETFVSNTFLGQHSTIGGDRGEREFTCTAIDLANNDNAITDVAIFSAAICVMLKGQANVVTGVHCYNKATWFGGIGILVKLAGKSQAILDNCYLDFNAIVLEDPVQVHVTNGFFLGDENIVLKSVNGKIFGLNIVNNMCTGSSQVPIVQLEGQFGDTDQVVIYQNNVIWMGLKSTVGRLNVEGNGTKWVADFSSVLVFPNKINNLDFQYSFYTKGDAKFTAHAVTNVSNNVVVVESENVVNGVVSVVVH